MTTDLLNASPSPGAIASAQRTNDGVPRFCVPAVPGDARWTAAAAQEADGGVCAEIRIFLDEQLETGDLVLDVAPGFGFVALGAATAPSGVPAVFVHGLPAERLAALQDAAADAGAWLESLDAPDAPSLRRLLDDRLDPEGRVVLHADAVTLAPWLDRLDGAGALDRLAAACVSGALPPETWPALAHVLDATGLRACALAEGEAGAVLVPLHGAFVSPLIAVPASLFEEPAGAADPDDLFPVAAAALAVQPSVAPVTRGWQPLGDGLSLVAPHSRTGYGVTGAHLLRALQARGVPVAFFPMGPVDASLTHNPALRDALDAQARYNADAPSVRLAQQFDLALHAGRGPRVGFPIFETERFTPRELHHLRQQDALLVCTPWARDVCRANGLEEVPVHLVPLGVDRAVFHEHVTPAHRWEETVFLHVGKLEPRKGQRELLRAFEAAFTPRDAVRLVLACHNPFQARDAFEAALAPFRRSPMARRITLVTTELATSRDVAALMASADCGVFPARAEGWNLEALEMLALGKRVIATHATGHTAYLTPDNATLLSLGAPEPATAGHMLGTWGSWGEAQHEQLVEALRATHAARRQGPLPVNAAGLATAATHTWEASADALLAALAAPVRA